MEWIVPMIVGALIFFLGALTGIVFMLMVAASRRGSEDG